MSGLLERKDAALLVAVAALLTRVVGDVNDELHQFDGPQNVHGKDHDNAMRMAQRAYLWKCPF